MDINKRNRTELKSYFVKNAIPTESNFADLIEGALNQKDDGIVKLPGDPLSLEAAGDATSLKKAINVYRNFSDANPDWTINLNPRSTPSDASTGKLGFNVSDGEGNSRLFIDRSTGNVGIGTISPGAKLQVTGGAITPAAGNSEAAGIMFPKNPGGGSGDAAWIRYYAREGEKTTLEIGIANDRDDHIALMASGNVGIGITSPGEKLHVSGGKIQLDGAQQLKFTDADTTNNLKVQLWSGYGLGINGSTLFYAANGRHSWRDNNGTNERMALTTGADGGLTVLGTGNSSFAGNVGIGTTTISAGVRLQVAGGAITPAAGNTDSAGIMFPKNPGGGSGDAAWIRYYARDGEKTTLEIGTANDVDDHIALMASGGIGIGITAPTKRLQVEGGELLVRASHNNTTADIGAFYANNQSQGIGIGYNRLEAIGSNTNQHICLMPKGTGNVGIGSSDPQSKLQVAGGISANGNETTHSQGAYLEWNKDGASGITYLLNQKGLGTGGIIFGEIDASNAVTQRMRIDANGNVVIGTPAPDYKLTVSAASTHLQLRREPTETTGGTQLFLELVQVDSAPAKVPEVYPSIRFHHHNRFWQRIEARSDGFHFKEGNLPGDSYVAVRTGNAFVSGTLPVPGGVETLRMLRGVINSNGTVFAGSGFAVSRVGAGLYDITFSQAFTSIPGASATQIFGAMTSGTASATNTGGDTRDNAVISHLSANMMRVKTGGSSGAADDRAFTFLVIGPR